MTQQRDIERVLDHWFGDGPVQAPDRVVDIVGDRIERQSQRPAWRLRWRQTNVNTYTKVAVAAAAVLIVAVVGYNLLPNRSGGVGGPAPTAVPTDIPSVAPSASASAVFPSWYRTTSETTGVGRLPSGTQTVRSFAPAFTYSVPEGWVNAGDEVDFYDLFPDTPTNQAETARSGELANSIHMGPLERPYFVCESVENNTGTAGQMVAAAAANDALTVTGVVDVTIGGLTGKRLDVRANPEWAGPCPGDPPGTDLNDRRARAYLLDAPGRGVIVIFVASLHAADHEAFLLKATPVVESFDFTS